MEGEEHAVSAGVLVFVPKGVRRSTRSASEDFAYLSIHRRRGALRIGDERVEEVGRLLPMSRLDADQGSSGSLRRRSRGVRGVRDGIGRARRLSPPQAIEEADVRTSKVRLTEATSVARRHRERGGHSFSPVLLRSVHQVSGRARMPAMFSQGRRWLRAVLLGPYAGEDTLAALFRCLGGFYERGYGKGLGRCRPRPPSGRRP